MVLHLGWCSAVERLQKQEVFNFSRHGIINPLNRRFYSTLRAKFHSLKKNSCKDYLKWNPWTHLDYSTRQATTHGYRESCIGTKWRPCDEGWRMKREENSCFQWGTVIGIVLPVSCDFYLSYVLTVRMYIAYSSLHTEFKNRTHDGQHNGHTVFQYVNYYVIEKNRYDPV